MGGSQTQVEIWTNYFDIVILPPPVVRDYAIELSARLKNYGAKFALGNRRYLPHISLYHIPVLPRDFDEFSTEVKEIAASSTGGALNLHSIKLPLLLTEKP